MLFFLFLAMFFVAKMVIDPASDDRKLAPRSRRGTDEFVEFPDIFPS